MVEILEGIRWALRLKTFFAFVTNDSPRLAYVYDFGSRPSAISPHSQKLHRRNKLDLMSIKRRKLRSRFIIAVLFAFKPVVKEVRFPCLLIGFKINWLKWDYLFQVFQEFPSRNSLHVYLRLGKQTKESECSSTSSFFVGVFSDVTDEKALMEL